MRMVPDHGIAERRDAAYMDAVKYVEERYYLKVTRYTNSGFLRLKLALLD
jgi:hypothetical protein